MEQQTMESIILYDTDNNEIEFDVMDKFEFRNEVYYVLLPVDYDSDDVEFVILREMTDENNEIALIGIEEEEILDAVFDEYKKRQKIQD